MEPMVRRRGYSLLENTFLTFVRVEATARRVLDASRRGLGALVAEAMSVDELRELSPRVYSTVWPTTTRHQGLWDWEAAWFRKALPAAPARLFVGGAGAGRESQVLASQGYHVDALEPALGLLDALRGSLAGKGDVFGATYEDLSRAVLDGGDGPAAAMRGRRYDAVILGWGSLTHVMTAAERARTLAVSCALTDGPILASFWMREISPEGEEKARSTRLGRAVGRRLARLRLGDAPPASEISAFGHAFSPDELEELAGRVGRKIVWEGRSGEYPHATLIK